MVETALDVEKRETRRKERRGGRRDEEEGGTGRKEGQGGTRNEESEKKSKKKLLKKEVAKGRIIGLAGPCWLINVGRSSLMTHMTSRCHH